MKFIIWTILSQIALLTFGQVTQEWVSRYNGPGNGSDIARSIAVDAFGNVYVTGGSPGSGTNYDYATIKYNSLGIELWAARYGGPGFDDAAVSIAVDSLGNVYVTGTSGTVKYNFSGVQQWVSAIGSMNDLVIDEDNYIYVTGNNGNDYLTIKYNSAGFLLWIKTYNGPSNMGDVATSLTVDNTGDVFVTGYTYLGSHHTDYATIKYNSLGVQQWVQIYGPGDNVDIANSIALDVSGNVYVTGKSYLSGDDYATIKYSSSGVQQWVQRYNGPANNIDWASSIAIDNLDNIYVTGMSYGIGTSGDYATIKYNSSGIQQWVQRYNGTGNGEDRSHAIVLDGMGNVYITGEIVVGGTNKDYATIKYDSSGAQQWVQSYNGPAYSTDYAYSIEVDVSGNVYVTGTSFGGNGTGYDYATIKYSQLTGINHISSESPKGFGLHQNYPNPFNPTTKIRFALASSPQGEGLGVSVIIFDILGREVTTLVNEQLKAGTYETEWDATNYPSGVYYYKLIAGDFSDTKKMVVIK